MRDLLIAGIDPGTTSAYALIDLKGNILRIESSKPLGMKNVIPRLTKLGKVVLIGCDKAKPPVFVSRVKTKLGAKLIYPKEDLKIAEKTDIVNELKYADKIKGQIKNTHERDALASAWFVYKEIEMTMNKVNRFLERQKLPKDKKNQLIWDVLKNNSNIIDAWKKVKEKKPEKKKTKPIALSPKSTAKPEATSVLKKEIATLKKYTQTLEKKLKEKQVKKVYVEKDKELLEKKERNLRSLRQNLKQKQNLITKLNRDIRSLNQNLAHIHANLVLKRLRNLTEREFRQKYWLKITKKDVLYVDNGDEFSAKIIPKLKENIIVFGKVSPKTKKMFISMNASKLKIRLTPYFVFVNKQEFLREKGKLGILDKVVKEYKKGRKKEL